MAIRLFKQIKALKPLDSNESLLSSWLTSKWLVLLELELESKLKSESNLWSFFKNTLLAAVFLFNYFLLILN